MATAAGAGGDVHRVLYDAVALCTASCAQRTTTQRRVHRSQWGNLRLSRQIATSEVQFLIKDERFVQKRPSDLSRSRSLLSSAPLFVEFHPGGEYCRDVEGRGISQADSHPAPLAVAQNVEPRYPTRPKRHPKQLSLGFPYRP